MEYSSKKAFTLIEVIVVVAIIAVLTALLVPTLGSLASSSQANACNDYRTVAIGQYATKTVGDPSYTLSSFLLDKGVTCPYGGAYSPSKDEDGNNVIICSAHELSSGGVPEDPGTVVGRSVYETYLSFVQRYDAASPEEQKAMANGSDNDSLRKALRAQYGEWPQFPQALIDKYNINVAPGETLYVQPFVNSNRDQAGYTDVVVYASVYPQNGKWYVGLVYDHEEGVWYQGPGLSVTSKWTDIKATLHDPNGRWKPLK
ncbi:MAG: prepilin-type N-terminal cleavage/methylation domain-containing protein [Christensenella sp.]|uniref:prepilin-type N-terminal cleavage/methylation domain-containing protein n=1 Tax=Christensenella sp. TaxID=1935934 RepID=UPI002B1EF642|nr:prepilin-type N-terminal cleavage/methylation domain-containing protein [Christensenella sp.]MEA5002006.1 prepilin-type N-terminal cleavage/methylation domain-containing protein [Christensenella sp.]